MADTTRPVASTRRACGHGRRETVCLVPDGELTNNRFSFLATSAFRRGNRAELEHVNISDGWCDDSADKRSETSPTAAGHREPFDARLLDHAVRGGVVDGIH